MRQNRGKSLTSIAVSRVQIGALYSTSSGRKYLKGVGLVVKQGVTV